MSGIPGKARFGGYAYVLEFSNGHIKVGSSMNPAKRIGTHASNAEGHAIAISRWWVSPVHLDFYGTEKSLLKIADNLGGTRIRNEYFVGVPFESVRSAADHLSFPPVDMVRAEVEERAQHEQARAVWGNWRVSEDSNKLRQDPAGDYMDAAADAVLRLFGANGPDGDWNVPEIGDDALLDHVVRLAEALGRPLDYVLDMNFIDQMEMLIETLVHSTALKMRTYALMAGRSDLTTSMREHLGLN